MYKKTLKKAIPHLVAITLFLAFSAVYFSPQLSGYQMKQSDHDNYSGMSKEIRDFRQEENKEALWTNSMFGGMPAYQISLYHNKNLIKRLENVLVRHLLGNPISILFLCFLGFYILLLCFKVNPWISIIGTIAFGLSTLNILYLGAGHNSRVHAIAFMAPLIGSVVLAYRRKLYLGAILTSLFLCLQVSANHLQETYYLLFVIAGIVLFELYRHFKEKKLKAFLKASVVLAAAAILGILPTMSNLLTTNEYSKFTTRSKSELTIPLGKEEGEATSGLDRNYIKDYNLGKGEVWSVLIPNVKGGESGYLGMHKDKIIEHVKPQLREFVAQQSSYWGEQRYTGGAFYFGASMFLLFILALVFIKDPLKYMFLSISALAIVLSWKESSILDFFIDYVPMFNKFRDSKIMLVLLQISIPLLGTLFVKKLMDRKIDIKKALYTIGATTILLLAFYITPTTWFDFFSSGETHYFNKQLAAINDPQSIAQFEEFRTNIEQVRVAIFKADVLRSLFFVILIAGIVLLFLKTKMKTGVLIASLAAIVLVDLWVINKRYINNDKYKGKYERWVDESNKQNPYRATVADKFILQNELNSNPQIAEQIQTSLQKHFSQNKFNNRLKEIEQENIAFRELNKATNYRVLTLEDPFNNAAIPYFHKSIGGYHGAKLRKFQELIEARISKEMYAVSSELQAKPTDSIVNALLESKIPTLNMLNTKYIIYNSRANPIINNHRNNYAWFVKDVQIVESADEEILALSKIDPKNTAVIHNRFIKENLNFSFDSTAQIKMLSYKPNHIVYEYSAKSTQFAVFSEIYYPKGWNVYVDGEQTDYYRANYVLRSMFLKEGNHKVEFKFEPKSFKTGETISLLGSILLLILLAFILYMEFKKKLNTEAKSKKA